MLAEQVRALQCHCQPVTLESRSGTALVSPSAEKKFSGWSLFFKFLSLQFYVLVRSTRAECFHLKDHIKYIFRTDLLIYLSKRNWKVRNPCSVRICYHLVPIYRRRGQKKDDVPFSFRIDFVSFWALVTECLKHSGPLTMLPF